MQTIRLLLDGHGLRDASGAGQIHLKLLQAAEILGGEIADFTQPVRCGGLEAADVLLLQLAQLRRGRNDRLGRHFGSQLEGVVLGREGGREAFHLLVRCQHAIEVALLAEMIVQHLDVALILLGQCLDRLFVLCRELAGALVEGAGHLGHFWRGSRCLLGARRHRQQPGGQQ